MSIATLIAGPWGWVTENGTKLMLYAALLASIWVHGCHTGEMRKEKEVGSLETSLGVCKGSVDSLQGAVDRQNTASAATAAEGARRLEASQKARATAEATLAKLRTQQAAADAYQRPAGVEECAAARSIVEKDNGKR